MSVTFSASDDTTECLRSVNCISHLTERYVKMRLLWEIQNRFHSDLPEQGVSPNSLEAMVLCVLSFPAVSMDIKEAPSSDRASKIRRRREERVVDLFEKNDYEFRIDDYEYDIRASCGPQNVSINLSFSSADEHNNIVLSVRIFPAEGSRLLSFDWQAWREAFYGRLEGSRLQQENLGMETQKVLPTPHPIWARIDKTRGLSAGTGSTMSVWKGWIPPRGSICKYEIATVGFILQTIPAGSIDITVSISATLVDTFSVPRETWAHVAYEDAKPASLKHASLVAQEILKSVTEGTDAFLRVQDAISRAEKLICGELSGDVDLLLVELEVAAIELGDTAALEKAMDLLLRNSCTENIVERGLRLLERFYISKDGDGDPESAERNGTNFHQFFEDDNRVNVVLSLFDKLFMESKHNHFVAQRYMRFVLMMSHYKKLNCRESACHPYIQIPCFQRAYTGNDEGSVLNIRLFENPLH